MDEPVEIPITDELDLHAFAPRDAIEVLGDYLALAAAKGYRVVRIIHGKGSGALRESVHAFLRRSPAVRGFRLDEGPGGWGATIVTLKGEEDGAAR